MAVAASVKTVITVKGNDQASRQIKKSTTAMGRLSSSMTAATAKSQALRASLRSMATGDISGALSSVGGLLGGPGGAGGIAAAATAATAATAALAVGFTAAAFKTAQWAEEMERLRVQLDNAFGPNGVEQALAFADAIGGVSAKSVGKLASTIKQTGITAQFTVDQLQELGNRAAKAGKTGDEALEGLNRALQTGTTRALKQVGVFINSGRVLDAYAASIGTTTTKLTDFEKQSAVAAAITEELGRATDNTTTAHQKLDSILARVDNTMLRLKMTLSDVVGGESADFLKRVLDLVDSLSRWSGVLINLLKFGLFPFIAGTHAAVIALSGLVKVVTDLADGGSFAKAGKEMKKLGADVLSALDPTKALRDTWAAANKAMSATPSSVGDGVLRVNDTLRTGKRLFTDFVGGVKSLYKSTVGGADAAVASAKKVVDAIGKGASRATERRRLKAVKRLRQARSKAAAARLREERFFDDLIESGDRAVEEQIAKNAERARAHTQSINEIIFAENQLAQVKAANNPAELARLQNLQTEAELQQKIATIKQNFSLSEVEQQRMIDATRGIAHAKQMKRIDEATKAENQASAARINGMIAVGQASVGLLEAVGVNGRAIAAFQAGLAAAQAFLAFSVGDIPGMIAATAAAINFGKIAGSSPETPSSSGAAASAPALTSPGITQPSSGTGGGGASYNITINGVYATAAETGAAIKQALGAAAATGMQGT
jgi:hypothetical protein